MADYVSSAVLQQIAEADESSTIDVFDRLATAVSRQFDRECEVANDFFVAAVSGNPGIATRTFITNGTRYLAVPPYESGSITEITIDGNAVTLGDKDTYREINGYLLLTRDCSEFTEVSITARFGFAAIPADIVQACIEQALFMWRRKDLAFADMSGVSAAALAAEFTPTFEAVAKRYREIYSSRNYFA